MFFNSDLFETSPNRTTENHSRNEIRERSRIKTIARRRKELEKVRYVNEANIKSNDVDKCKEKGFFSLLFIVNDDEEEEEKYFYHKIIAKSKDAPRCVYS